MAFKDSSHTLPLHFGIEQRYRRDRLRELDTTALRVYRETFPCRSRATPPDGVYINSVFVLLLLCFKFNKKISLIMCLPRWQVIY